MVSLIFVLIDLLAHKTTAIDHKEHENNESMAEFTVYTLSIILSVYGPKIVKQTEQRLLHQFTTFNSIKPQLNCNFQMIIQINKNAMAVMSNFNVMHNHTHSHTDTTSPI